MITYRSILENGGTESGGGDCIIKDGMLSDLSSYKTINLPKSLVEGDLYGLSIKATNDNNPEGQMVYGCDSYSFVYTGGAKTLSFTCNKGTNTIQMRVHIDNANQITAEYYSGTWQYIWCRLYHYPVPSDANYQ